MFPLSRLSNTFSFTDPISWIGCCVLRLVFMHSSMRSLALYGHAVLSACHRPLGNGRCQLYVRPSQLETSRPGSLKRLSVRQLCSVFVIPDAEMMPMPRVLGLEVRIVFTTTDLEKSFGAKFAGLGIDNNLLFMDQLRLRRTVWMTYYSSSRCQRGVREPAWNQNQPVQRLKRNCRLQVLAIS